MLDVPPSTCACPVQLHLAGPSPADPVTVPFAVDTTSPDATVASGESSVGARLGTADPVSQPWPAASRTPPQFEDATGQPRAVNGPAGQDVDGWPVARS